MTTSFTIGDKEYSITLPDHTVVLGMKGAEKIADPVKAVAEALETPYGSPAFETIVREKVDSDPKGEAVIVISDNTRPVPYKGPQGILLPLIVRLITAGIPAEQITVLCANGTHTPLAEEVFRSMIDPEVFRLGVNVVNHDCLDESNLAFLGHTSTGTKIKVNATYVNAHIKILTGLVESHFMAGVSGGRKSICPGLIGEDSTYIFHSAAYLDNEKAVDLVLDGNPCHEEALEVARIVGADFIFNVTLDQDFDVTGYYAGDMEAAHLAAYEKVRDSIIIRENRKFDIVVTHAGFVGKNHYQGAKAATAAIPLLKPDSLLLMTADCNDVDPVGKSTYRRVLTYLKDTEAESFIEMIKSDEWAFVPDQWQVQMWAKLFRVIGQDQFVFYAPQIMKEDYDILPGEDGNRYLPESKRYRPASDALAEFLVAGLSAAIERKKNEGCDHPTIAWLADGPYGIVEE